VCGITGYTHIRREYAPARIREATNALFHRGPDQQGVYQTRTVSLGAVRLKIIDLDSGDQPIVGRDGDSVLLFNGEIYNYLELKAELEGLGHSFATRSDSEVVLQAFLQWDTACFQKLRGMFAIAIWQESKHRLVLARDRMGIKPLYVHRAGQDIYFGSELKTLFIHPEIERRLDAVALQHYLSLNYVPGPRTLVDGIEKLRPAHYLEWKNGKVRTESYWKVSFAVRPACSLQEASEELDGLLKDAMQEHLLSDVPLGIWLSGGVDSSTILHYAREASSARMKTFSISFQGRSFDETGTTRETVARYGTEHQELDLNPGLDLAGAIEKQVFYSDEPCADAGALPVWFLSALSRQHVTVALSGEGGDELFGGYITYQADRLARTARRAPATLRRGLLGLLRYWPVSNEKISLEYKLKRFLEGSLLPADEAHTYWNGTFSEAQQRNLLCGPRETTIAELYDDQAWNGSESSLNRYLAFDQRYYLCDDVLQKVDRMSMAHSLEVRPPFLDHRVVEFAASLPEEFKIQGSRKKIVLRYLMKDKLPPGALRQRKNGLDIPTHDWLRGSLRSLLLDTLSTPSIEETGLFQPEKIESLIQDHMTCRANVGYHLWGLLILFLWMKQWDIKTVRDPEIFREALEDVSDTA